jgi:hypothetical protein
MALDETAKLANVKRSLRKFFVDNLVTTESKTLVFDRWMATPNILNLSSDVNDWYSINFGNVVMSQMSFMEVSIFCCTQKDNSGVKLTELRDLLFGYLRDDSQNDGIRRVSFIDASDNVLGGLMIVDIIESGDMEGAEGTKYYSLSCQIRFSSKV